MTKLLIIADDCTGALDTGVKFFSAGADTRVMVGTDVNFAETDVDVLVLCVPTRHLLPVEAYEVIKNITERAVAAKIGCIYKKTDSALRGNVGAELSALLAYSGRKALYFIPALPQMNRITVEGTYYVEGRLLSESVFGKDPFNPVTESYVPALIGTQSDVEVKVTDYRKIAEIEEKQDRQIYVFDCSSTEDMERTVKVLAERDRLHVLAGCFGFAAYLPHYLGFTGGNEPCGFCGYDRFLVICGSMNSISGGQMDFAEQHGFYRMHIPADVLLSDSDFFGGEAGFLCEVWETCKIHPYFMLDTMQRDGRFIADECGDERFRVQIAKRLGVMIKELLDRGMDRPLLIIGGDTLLAFLEAVGSKELIPVYEIQQGAVLNIVRYQGRRYEIISKSGGFGSREFIVDLKAKQLKKEQLKTEQTKTQQSKAKKGGTT